MEQGPAAACRIASPRVGEGRRSRPKREKGENRNERRQMDDGVRLPVCLATVTSDCSRRHTTGPEIKRKKGLAVAVAGIHIADL